jgi:hypothetical protein
MSTLTHDDPEFACPEHNCTHKFKRSRSIARHVSRVHKKSAANHPWEQRVVKEAKASTKGLSVKVPTSLEPAKSPTSTAESQAAATAFFKPTVQLDGPTAVSPRLHGQVDMASLWSNCTHEKFVSGFFANANLEAEQRQPDMPHPVSVLVQESSKSWNIDSAMYLAMMAGLSAQQLSDEFF